MAQAPTPSEHSSGESARQGGITKTGNKHLGKFLVEAAWRHKRQPASETWPRAGHPTPRREGAAKGIEGS